MWWKVTKNSFNVTGNKTDPPRVSNTLPKFMEWKYLRFKIDEQYNEPHCLSNQKNFVYLAEIGD